MEYGDHRDDIVVSTQIVINGHHRNVNASGNIYALNIDTESLQARIYNNQCERIDNCAEQVTSLLVKIFNNAAMDELERRKHCYHDYKNILKEAFWFLWIPEMDHIFGISRPSLMVCPGAHFVLRPMVPIVHFIAW